MAATILRDREVPGGSTIAYGNEAAINPLIATHSVIIDVTAGIIWVSQAPHQLRAFVPFGLANFDKPENVRLIPPDRMLEDGTYKRFITAEQHRVRAEELLKIGDFEGAQPEALTACDLNPGYYRVWWLRGKIATQYREISGSPGISGKGSKALSGICPRAPGDPGNAGSAGKPDSETLKPRYRRQPMPERLSPGSRPKEEGTRWTKRPNK